MAKDTIKKPIINIIFESTSMSEVKEWKELPGGHIEFPAVLQTVDEINRNTNCYPKDVLMDSLHNERIEELIRRNCWFGEEAHPWDRKNFSRSIDILPDNISHRIMDMPTLNGNNVCSRVCTTEPKGKRIVHWITNDHSQLGFSLRGVTPYFYTKDTPVKHKVIRAPMSVLTYDIVFYPSHPGALAAVNTTGMTPAVEGAVFWDDIKNYITEESESFKIFKNELGIDIKNGEPIYKGKGNTIDIVLEDGRLANLSIENSILKEVSKWVF